MTDIQAILVELAAEIDEISKENHLTYYLDGKTLRDAMRKGGFETDEPELELLMPAKDAVSLMHILKDRGRPDRYLESMMTNGKFPGVFLHYGNRNTLDFNTTQFGMYENHGICVTIHILRPAGKGEEGRVEQMRTGMECAWEAGADPIRLAPPKAVYGSSEAKMVRRLKSLLGSRLTARRLFTFFLGADRSAASGWYLKPYWKGKREFVPAEWFGEGRPVDFEGHTFNAPADAEAYLSKTIGKDWKTRAPKYKPYLPTTRLIDTEIPYAEYLEALRAESIDQDTVWKKWVDFRQKQKEFREYSKLRKKAWNYLFLSGTRFALWNYYAPRKKALNQLYIAGDLDGLRRELQPYVEEAREQISLGLGLYFDKDLFRYLKIVLDHQGESKLFQKIEKAVPKNHREPIVLKDCRGEPIPMEQEQE